MHASHHDLAEIWSSGRPRSRMSGPSRRVLPVAHDARWPVGQALLFAATCSLALWAAFAALLYVLLA